MAAAAASEVDADDDGDDGTGDAEEQARGERGGPESFGDAEHADRDAEGRRTDTERRKLRRALPDDAGEIAAAIYDSATDCFVVVTDAARYQVASNGRAIAPSTVEQVATTRGQCDSACASCALWAVDRGLCYGSCALVTTSAGAPLCTACLTANSVGLDFADCGTCADCI